MRNIRYSIAGEVESAGESFGGLGQALLIALVGIFTGPLGLFVLFVATSIGLIAPLSGVKRSHCMGVLMLNVILFYSGVTLFIMF